MTPKRLDNSMQLQLIFCSLNRKKRCQSLISRK